MLRTPTAWSDVQNWVRMSCARRKTACDVLEAARGRFVQTTENPAASPGISKLNPRRRSHSLFTNRRCGAALPVRSTPYPRRQALPLARARDKKLPALHGFAGRIREHGHLLMGAEAILASALGAATFDQLKYTEKTNGESTPPAITSFSAACSGASSVRK